MIGLIGTWLLPGTSEQTKDAHRREARRRYIRQWEHDHRKQRNKYWREYYRTKYQARRAYLDRKQREYRDLVLLSRRAG